MNTLIELYDERAIENILAPDMFRPRRIVYLCPGEIAQNRTRQEPLAAFFRRRGWEPELHRRQRCGPVRGRDVRGERGRACLHLLP